MIKTTSFKFDTHILWEHIKDSKTKTNYTRTYITFKNLQDSHVELIMQIQTHDELGNKSNTYTLNSCNIL